MMQTVKDMFASDTWRVTHSSAQICAVKGSTVEIPCTYTYPSTIRQQTTVVQSRFWFTKDRYEPVDVRTDPDYSGRVEYLFHENVCTLRIKNLRERDSAVYKFMFTTNQPGGSLTGDEGVTLVNTTVNLFCYSSCNVADNPSYVWYRNGKNMTAETDANPAANYTWFKEDEDSPTASGQIFTISNFSADHSGRYYCEAQNTRGRHNSTLHLLVVTGKLLTFTCTRPDSPIRK
uniref:Ig-like domain-containing protein n=1 Tax=Labrus bergylta TaxID=56723 RepID=A0A3Q3MKQ9_9LABR